MTEEPARADILFTTARRLATADRASWPISELDELIFGGRDACVAMLVRALPQLLRGRGGSPDEPLRGLGVEGVHLLARTLGLEVRGQVAIPRPTGAMVDEIRLATGGGEEVVIYNLVGG